MDGTRRIISSALVALLALGVVVGVGPARVGTEAAEPGGVVRVAGSDRVETAAALARDGWPSGADEVVLVRSDDHADALAGGLLAAELGGPLLLTASQRLSEATADTLRLLGPERVWVLGGTAAVEVGVTDELEAGGVQVRRIGGLDRYDTAGRVTDVLDELAQTGPTRLVALGNHPDRDRAWPDAVSAGAWAMVRRPPTLLLVGPTTAPQPTLDRLSGPTTVVGGTAAIGDAVTAQLADRVGHAPVRLAGADRYGTSRAVAEAVLAEVDGGPRPLVVVTGRDFPDALAAAPYAAARDALLLLVPQSDLTAVEEHLPWLQSQRGRISDVTVVGGTAAVSELVEGQLQALLDGEVQPAGQGTWTFEPSGLVVEPGSPPVRVRMVNIDAAGRDTGRLPTQIEVRTAVEGAGSLEPLGGNELLFTPPAAAATGLFGATVDGRTARPLTATTATVAEDTVVLDDRDVVALGAARPLAESTLAPGAATGPFTAAEVADRVRIADGQASSVPLVLVGEPLPAGTTVVGAGRTPALGRVVDTPALERNGHTLHRLVPVQLSDAFEQLSVDLDQRALERAGLAVGTVDADDGQPVGQGAAADASARTGAVADDGGPACDTSASVPIGNVSFDPKVTPSFDTAVDIEDGELTSMAVTSRVDFQLDFGGSIGLRTSVGFACTFADRIVDLPLTGPLAAAISPYVRFGLPVSGQITVSGGHNPTYSIACKATAGRAQTIRYSPASGFEVTADDDPPTPVECEQEASGSWGGGASNLRIDASTSMGGRGSAGLRLGGATLKGIAALFGYAHDLGAVDLFEVVGRVGVGVTWMSATAVVNDGRSRSKVEPFSEVFAGITLSDVATLMSKVFGVDRLTNIDVNAVRLYRKFEQPAWYRSLDEGEVTVTVGDDPVSGSAVVIEGDTLVVEATVDHLQVPRPPRTDAAMVAAELWETDGPERTDLLELAVDGNRASGQVTIDEDQCDDLADETTFTIVASNELFGLVETAGHAGQLTVRCDTPAIEFSRSAIQVVGEPDVTTAVTIEGYNLPDGTTWTVEVPDFAQADPTDGTFDDPPPDTYRSDVTFDLTATCPEGSDETLSGTLRATADHPQLDEELTAEVPVDLVCRDDDGDDDVPPPPAGGSPAGAYGDPHLRTFDGLGYDYQAQGEYWLVRSTTDQFAIQNSYTHQQGTGTRVSWLATWALRTPAGHVVTYDGVTVRIDGTPASVDPTPLDDGSVIARDWAQLADGTRLRYGGTDLLVDLAADRAGQVEGLLGDADGNPDDDGQDTAGQVLFGTDTFDGLTFEQTGEILYGQFGPTWTVAPDDRLLPNAAVAFDAPDGPVELDPDQLADGLAACRDAGVPTGLLEQCAFDWVVTGGLITIGELTAEAPITWAGNSPNGQADGQLTGAVVAHDGSVAADQCVTAWDPADPSVPSAATATNDDGIYVLALAAGEWLVSFGCDVEGTIEQFHPGVTDPAQATRVTVLGDVTSVLDGNVTYLPRATGTVTAGEAPVEYGCVEVYEPGGDEPLRTLDTDEIGAWSATLPAETTVVQVLASTCDPVEYAPTWFGDTTDRAQTVDVDVAVDKITAGLDIELRPAGDGEIVGTATVDGQPARDVCVAFLDADQPDVEVAYGYTELEGTYTSGPVTPGDYLIQYTDCGSDTITQYHDGVTEPADADRVTVFAGQTTTVDEALTRKPSVAGTVTGDGQPLRDICVDVLDANDGTWLAGDYTAFDGTWRAALASADITVQVRFSDCRDGLWTTEWYDDAADVSTAEPILVDGVLAGIDAQLAPAPQGSLTVTLADATDAPVADGCILVRSTDEDALYQPLSTFTTSAGVATFDPLPSGTWHVQVGCGGALAPEWYEDADARDDADTVTVTEAANTAIGMTVARLATVTGTVTGPDGPVADASVEVLATDGRYVGGGFTDTDGQYVATVYEPATTQVVVRADPFDGVLAPAFHPQAATAAGATAITVGLDQTTTDVDIALDVGGQFTGTILDVAGNPAENACVTVLDGDDRFTGSDLTGPDGAWNVEALAAAGHRVRVADCSGNVAFGGWYDDGVLESDATPHTPTTAETRDLGTLQLAPAGTLAGRVLTSPDVGATNACIRVHGTGPWAGQSTVLNATRPGDAPASAIGRWSIVLPVGDWKLEAHDCATPGDSVFYDGVDTLEEATTVVLEADQTRTGLDIDIG